MERDDRDDDDSSTRMRNHAPRKRSRSPARAYHSHHRCSRERSRSRSRRHPATRRSRSHSPSLSPPQPPQVRVKDPALVQLAAGLPAAQHREELLQALARHQVVICVGETGSGKTTQIPQFLYEATVSATAAAASDASDGADGADASGAPADSTSSSWISSSAKCIAVTQPRRVATISVAQRVADEMATDVGGTGAVGYAIRFDDRSSAHTRVKFVTDGVLVRECLADPLLRQYSCVMLDEAHERSIHTDVLVGLLRQLVQRRPHDFRLLVTSATLDHARFAAFFSLPRVEGPAVGGSGNTVIPVKPKTKTKVLAPTPTLKPTLVPCPVVTIPGRAYPVDIFHSKTLQIMGRKGPLSTYVRAAVETALQVHNSEPPGHILVFLTGRHEIDDACHQINALHREQLRDGTADGIGAGASSLELRVLPLYAALPSHAQRAIFAPVPPHVRKVIVATNIAETSVTIDGVRYVVDCGFTKQNVYNPAQQMQALVVVPISKVAAQQRAGRAGRTAPGKCYRLYSKASYDQMLDETVPEIRRSNLANTVLTLKLLGIRDVLGFPYLDAPDEDALLDALQQLLVLGALDACGDATPRGRLMAAFPLEPKLARVLVEAIALQCDDDMVAIVSMLSAENVFEQRRQRRDGRRRNGDDRRRCRSGHSRHGDSDADSDSDHHSWEALVCRLESEALVSEYGDQLSYLALARGYARARDKAQWCRDRQLRLRALQTANAIETQLRGIVESIPQRDKDALVAQATAARASSSSSAHYVKNLSRTDRLRKSSFFTNAARRCTLQTMYRTLSRGDADSDTKLVHVHPESTLQGTSGALPEYCVYQELVVTSKPFMRHVVGVDAQWLDEYARGWDAVSLDALYALCGRTAPPERQLLSSSTHGASDSSHTHTSNSRKQPVDSIAISAARERFLARKQQQQQ